MTPTEHLINEAGDLKLNQHLRAMETETASQSRTEWVVQRKSKNATEWVDAIGIVNDKEWAISRVNERRKASGPMEYRIVKRVITDFETPL